MRPIGLDGPPEDLQGTRYGTSLMVYQEDLGWEFLIGMHDASRKRDNVINLNVFSDSSNEEATVLFGPINRASR